MSPATASRVAVVEAISDGANDVILSPPNQYDLPRYDATKDADAVPKYTREYLQRLSTAIDAHLRSLDDDIAHYPKALTKNRKNHKCLMALLIVLGLLWLSTAIVIVVAVFKGSGVGSGAS